MSIDDIYKDDFAVFILTHGRPNNVITYRTLEKAGYTGKIYIVIDNQDKTRLEYEKEFGDKVIVFDKNAIAEKFDEADNFNDKRAIVYARNASFEIAESLGIKYFVELDDDYTTFGFRFDDEQKYSYRTIKRNIDDVFKAILEFYIESGVDSISLAQGGDFIGGSGNALAKKIFLKRKCMNSFFCSTDRKFTFIGRINEDVNTYTRMASTGLLMFTTNYVSLCQKITQSNSGGMTDIYLDSGTYVKSFYSIIFHPSSVTIRPMGNSAKRLHHSVDWNKTTPKILREDIRKI